MGTRNASKPNKNGNGNIFISKNELIKNFNKQFPQY